MQYQPMPFHYEPLPEEEMMRRAKEYFVFMNKRRSIRHFSDRDIPDEVVDHLVMTASTAPSGANKQPWTFCVIRDKELKRRIRLAAEKEERESYNNRMS